MHFQKKITTTALIFLLGFNLPALSSKLYSDIPAGHWSETAADVLGEENIMPGASANEFGGNLTLTRYETAKIINGLMGNRSVPTSIILLSDVRSGHPDFRTIMKVLSAGLMETANNKFNGEKKVSRYEFAKFIIATLDYLQTDPISIRQPPKAIGNIAAEKRDLINKAVNYWQLTEGYNDWDQNINRYGALEMVARAAININPDLRIRIGDVVKQGGVTETPKTSEPTSAPTTMPTPARTPVPTQVPTAVPTLSPTSVPTYIPTYIPTLEPTRTPAPERTPVLSTPTPGPIQTPSSVPTPVATPTAIPTPIITETPVAIPTPIISIPTPVATPNVSVPGISSQVLRSQFTLRGIYNLMYSETIPSVFVSETVKSRSDSLGASVGGELSYWLNGFDAPFIKDMGLIVGFNALGSYVYPTENAATGVKPDTEISETFKGNLSILYKLVSTPDMEFAAGLDAFLRNNSRSSSHAVDSYWRASKSYMGIGARGLIGYRITDRIVLNGSLFAHYVSQSINEAITASSTSAAAPAGSVIDRFNIELELGGRWDLFQIGNSWIYLDGNVNGRILLGDGNQTIVGAGGGAGISF